MRVIESIGILATKGTLSSDLFHNTSELYSENIQIIEQVGEGLVELIEAGNINSIKMKTLLTKYLKPMMNKNIDHLVLGCSHYPFLTPLIKKIIPDSVKIIDSGKAVAKQVQSVLINNNYLCDMNITKNTFITNKHKNIMESILGNKYKVTKKSF